MGLRLWLGAAFVVGCGFGDNSIHRSESDAGTDVTTIDAPRVIDASIDTPVTTACTLLPQAGCGGGTPACDLTAADDGTTGCRAVTTMGTSDSRCSALTACSAGYSCVGELGVDSACMKFCADDSGCSGTGARCAYDLVSNDGDPLDIKVCSNACDVYLQTGCPSGMGCNAFDAAAGDFTDCRVMGTKSVGQTCATTDECSPGALCVNDGTARCRYYCKIGQSGSCPTSQTCSGFATSLTIGSTSYGFCH
jgi:hypothetical protein